MYWNKKQEVMMSKYINATSREEQLKYEYFVIALLNKVAIGIVGRKRNVEMNNTDIEDTINDLVHYTLEYLLHKKKYSEDKGSLFTFCTLVMQSRFYNERERLSRKKNSVTKTISDEQWHFYKDNHTYDNECEINDSREGVIEKFENIIKRLIREGRTGERGMKKIDLFRLCLKFFRENTNSDMDEFIDYILLHAPACASSIDKWFRQENIAITVQYTYHDRRRKKLQEQTAECND